MDLRNPVHVLDSSCHHLQPEFILETSTILERFEYKSLNIRQPIRIWSLMRNQWLGASVPLLLSYALSYISASSVSELLSQKYRYESHQLAESDLVVSNLTEAEARDMYARAKLISSKQDFWAPNIIGSNHNYSCH